MPSSIVAAVPTNSGNYYTATMSWRDVGSTALTGVSLAADLSAVTLPSLMDPWSGSVSLMCVTFGNADACLFYTNGAYTRFQDSYVGYYLETSTWGAMAYAWDYPITATLPANLWTRVVIRVTASTGTAEVLFGGTTVATGTAPFEADTVATATVGLDSSPTTSVPFTMYYDNVVATVTR